MGRIHLRNCLKLKTASLVAASDLSSKGRAFAKRHGVNKVYKEYEKLVRDPEVEAVIISLPTHLHEESSILSAEAGKSILLEKPLARNPSEGKKIVNACKNNNVKIMAGYHFRFSTQFRHLKECLMKGVLGEAQIAYATMIGPGPFFHRAEGYAPKPVPSWWFNKELTGGGALMDLGCHMINLVHWYFGDVGDVECYVGHRFNMDYEDYAICLCKMKSGTTATVTTGWFSREASARVEIFGTSKILTAKREASNKIVNGIRMLLGLTPTFNLPYYWLLEHFVNCLSNDRQPSPSGEEALKDLEVISQAYKNTMPLEYS